MVSLERGELGPGRSLDSASLRSKCQEKVEILELRFERSKHLDAQIFRLRTSNKKERFEVWDLGLRNGDFSQGG